METQGPAHLLPSHVDTDQILPGKYLHLNRDEFGAHALEGYHESYPDALPENAILVAGENIGLGSSREAAPIALQRAGVQGIVAESFARIFYRNCINIGLPIAQVPSITDYCSNGDVIHIDLAGGTVTNRTTDTKYDIDPLPENLQEILQGGGLVD